MVLAGPVQGQGSALGEARATLRCQVAAIDGSYTRVTTCRGPVGDGDITGQFIKFLKHLDAPGEGSLKIKELRARVASEGSFRAVYQISKTGQFIKSR